MTEEARIRELVTTLADSTPSAPALPGPSHVVPKRRQASLVVALSVLVALAVIAGIVLLPQRREAGPLGAISTDRLVISEIGGSFEKGQRFDIAVVYDLATGTHHRITLRGKRPGDFPYHLVLVGDKLVYPANSGVLAYSLENGRINNLGDAQWFLPHSDGKTVWLVKTNASYSRYYLERFTPDGTKVGRTISGPTSMFDGGMDVVGDYFLMNRNRHQVLWSFDRHRVERDLGKDLQPLALRGDSMAFLDECFSDYPNPCRRLSLLDAGSAAKRVFVVPDDRNVRGWIGNSKGNISPDSRHVAVRAVSYPIKSMPTKPGQLDRNTGPLAMIDLGTRKVSWVPESDGPLFAPVAWSSDARWLFYRNTKGEIGAYRPSDGLVRSLGGSCCGYGIVAVPATRAR